MKRSSMLSPRSLAEKFIPLAKLARGPQAFPLRPRKGGLPVFAYGAVQSLARLGSLEVRLARSIGEVRRAQALRFDVFYNEMSAAADIHALQTRRDSDDYDAFCDHMLVLDHDVPPNAFGRRKPRVVGTYRLLRQEIAEAHGGFYTAGEYDIQPLLDRKPGHTFLELGRSCVLAPYRNKRTVELLWQGIWAYVQMHDIDVMVGCASLEGTDPDRLALPLSFLHHFARAPEDWRVEAVPERAVEMDRMPKAEVDARAAMRTLPPLIKGYLRLGASFGEHAVVDYQFGTTDVLVVLPCDAIDDRYKSYYGGLNERRAT